MFRLNLWTRSFLPPPGVAPAGMEGYTLPNPLSPHALMTLPPLGDMTRDSGRPSNHPEAKDHPHPFLPMLRPGEHFPTPFYSPLHLPFLRPNMEHLLHPSGLGAFRPVGSPSDDRENYHSAFSLHKQSKAEHAASHHSGRRSNETRDEESDSPGREGRSSSVRSTDSGQLRYDRGGTLLDLRTTPEERSPARSLDPNPRCPLCCEALQGGDFLEHLKMELDRLKHMHSPAHNGLDQRLLNGSPSSGGDRDSVAMETISHSRYETYLRARSNRLTRLNAKRGTKKRKADDDANYPACLDVTGQLDESFESSDQLFLKKVRVDDGGSDREDGVLLGNQTWMGPTEDRLSPRIDNCVRHDMKSPCESQNGDVCERLSPDKPRSERLSPDKPRCPNCCKSYRNPLASVRCWHVHCEQCWNNILAQDQSCPQCGATVTEAELRRIFF